MFFVAFCFIALASAAPPQWVNTNVTQESTDTLESPKYEQVETHEEYEVRNYGSIRVVATEEELEMGKLEDEKDRTSPFFRLFGYIEGNNEKGIKIQMTRPVINKYETHDEKVIKTMAFVVPTIHIDDTPTPKAQDVKIENMDVGVVYVKRFVHNTRATPEMIKEMKETTLDVLAKKGITDIQIDPWYSVGYNAPFHAEQTFEIWFKKSA